MERGFRLATPPSISPDMASDGRGISRRTLLVGGGAGVGLLVAYALWPRHYAPNWRAAPGEQLFNAFLKIGRDGRVVVAVPQAEIGQGVYTSLPQIVAGRTGCGLAGRCPVEPAPISPLYANLLLAEELADDALPSALQGIGRWAAHEYATRNALMLTGGSTSVRAFEPRLREAGAAARALLMQEAAERWGRRLGHARHRRRLRRQWQGEAALRRTGRGRRQARGAGPVADARRHPE